jgi:hypothetical protein
MTREFFREMGGFEHYMYSSDSIFAIKSGFFMELSGQNGISVLGEPLFTWNRHLGSITMNDRNTKVLEDCINKQRSLLKERLKGYDGQVDVQGVKHALGITDSLSGDLNNDLDRVQ